MSDEKKKIIDNFCKSFLETDKKPTSFTEILNQSPQILKDCSENEAKNLHNNGYKKIRDLTKIKLEKIEKLANKLQVDENQLRKWVMAAGLVERAWTKRSAHLKREEMKIAVLGLDNAGKSSMLEAMSGRANLGDFIDLQPTRGVNVKKIDSENYNMVIWDFGGQIGHRHDYLQNPEDYFLHLDSLFYVIDMQEPDRFDEALEYFNQVYDILKFLNEMPYFLIMLNKADPDVASDPDFQINIEYMHNTFNEKLKGSKMSYEVVETSIYNFYAAEPEFAKTFKKFFLKSKDEITVEDSIKAISENLMSLSTTIVDSFTEIKLLISQISQPTPNLNSPPSTPQIPTIKRNAPISVISKVLPPPPPPKGPIEEKRSPAQSRTELMGELKNVLKFRRLLLE